MLLGLLTFTRLALQFVVKHPLCKQIRIIRYKRGADLVTDERAAAESLTQAPLCPSDRSACPAYPTELVFGLDMSDDVTPGDFGRQRSALLSLLNDISIAESNCPQGARVAVVGYNTYTKYLIRFQDYRRKAQLLEAVRNIAQERTSNKRQLGAAMRFVGQNIFKRVRAGIMMRKVAVFFSSGPTEEANDIVTAMMEYRALNIVPAVISLRNTPDIEQAMQVGVIYLQLPADVFHPDVDCVSTESLQTVLPSVRVAH